jgi:predicted DNA-binding transcriptional regulator YafY
MMKIDRLLQIVICLLNNKTVTAKQLAGRFKVSVRTIQRDMDSISLAGIPLTANLGSQGGYSLLPAFKLQNHFVKKEDFQIIIMALKSLSTSYKSGQLEGILDKYLTLADNSAPSIYLDYGVTREDNRVQQLNHVLEHAVSAFREITFTYRNVHGTLSDRRARPLALRFKWYAWYLFALDVGKNDYRTFKVARMDSLIMTETAFTPPKDVKSLLETQEREYLKTCETIEVWCHQRDILAVEEYFPEEKKDLLPDGHFIMHLHVPPNERLWQALLLSLGDSVKILSPEGYKNTLIETAQKFLSKYDI